MLALHEACPRNSPNLWTLPSISGGASMTVLGVYTGGTATMTGGASITTTPTANNIVQSYAGISDPVASNAGLYAAFTGLSSLGGRLRLPPAVCH
jgi:hypothetical protein